MGSSRETRRVADQVAIAAVAARVSAAAARIDRLAGCALATRCWRYWPMAAAPANPATAPSATGNHAWRRIIHRTPAAVAPIAILTPISCVRCATEYDATA